MSQRPCAKCRALTSQKEGRFETTREVARYTFTAELPGRQCEVCGQVYFDALSALRFDRALLKGLAEMGAQGSVVFRYLRLGLSLPLSRLARFLAVSEQTLAAWEENEAPPRSALALLGSLVLEWTGTTLPLHLRLDALENPPPPGTEVRVSPDESWDPRIHGVEPFPQTSQGEEGASLGSK